MHYENGCAKNVKLAYIGGGSRGWAWGLMSDLAQCEDMSGDVYLYDIDFEAAQHNEIIGNKFNTCEGAKATWNYHAAKTAEEALTGADFVIISILPGTFDEMESDIHAPEKYGIYQSVGDTSGPGGTVRALRSIPMFEEIALAIKENCPEAWVINYTNPMTVLVRTLYRVFPEIKAFGCCHEVFGTQKLLASIVSEEYGIPYKEIQRSDIKVNVLGVNHFTWLTSAQWRNVDLMPIYDRYAKKYATEGFYRKGSKDSNWMNNSFVCAQCVKFDLYNRFGWIAAAGDRHLAEFCPGKWYLASPEQVKEWKFGLTTVDWRRDDLKTRLEKRMKSDIAVPAPVLEDDNVAEEALFDVRRKTVPVLPMSLEEAILQMNLIGHSFYMYLDAETEKMSVVYKRHGNTYGVITPEE